MKINFNLFKLFSISSALLLSSLTYSNNVDSNKIQEVFKYSSNLLGCEETKPLSKFILIGLAAEIAHSGDGSVDLMKIYTKFSKESENEKEVIIKESCTSYHQEIVKFTGSIPSWIEEQGALLVSAPQNYKLPESLLEKLQSYIK